MSNFNKAVKKVLLHEGGYVDHPFDTGGATNWGITQGTYESYVGRKVTKDEIRNMPKGNAIQIYKELYWDKVAGDKIISYPISFIIFDQAVNRGVNTAIKQAQRVLGLPQTGFINNMTINALNNADEGSFVDDYLEESEEAYKKIVARNPTQEVFLAGWLKRVRSLRDYADRNMTSGGGFSLPFTTDLSNIDWGKTAMLGTAVTLGSIAVYIIAMKAIEPKKAFA